MENTDNNKLGLTSQEVELKSGEIVNIEKGDLLVFSSDVREIISIEKEGDYIYFITEGGYSGYRNVKNLLITTNTLLTSYLLNKVNQN